MKSAILIPIALLLLLAGPLHADPWRLTTAELETRPVMLLGIDQQGVRVRGPAGEQVLPLERFVQIERSDRPAPPEQGLVLQLTSGPRLAGVPAGVEDERLRWRSELLGEVVVPLQQVRSIVRPGQEREQPEPPGQDVVRLRNDDLVQGILVDLSDETASVMVGGETMALPMELIASIRLASAPGGGSPPAGRFLVRLADGSAWQINDLTIAGQRVSFRLLPNAPPRHVPVDQITAIEHLDGPVTWLSSLEPAEAVQTPLLGESWPAQMNRTVRGQPIRFGGEQFTRGIGVQAYSRLTWDLDGGHRLLRTRYALDGDLPHGEVTVRIRLDDETVHEQSQFRAGELSPVIEIELEQAKRLTLEVDFGGSLDVQARLNWIEAALLK